jgi:hypothetical protein
VLNIGEEATSAMGERVRGIRPQPAQLFRRDDVSSGWRPAPLRENRVVEPVVVWSSFRAARRPRLSRLVASPFGTIICIAAAMTFRKVRGGDSVGTTCEENYSIGSTTVGSHLPERIVGAEGLLCPSGHVSRQGHVGHTGSV